VKRRQSLLCWKKRRYTNIFMRCQNNVRLDEINTSAGGMLCKYIYIYIYKCTHTKELTAVCVKYIQRNMMTDWQLVLQTCKSVTPMRFQSHTLPTFCNNTVVSQFLVDFNLQVDLNTSHSGQCAAENTYVDPRVAERCRKRDLELNWME